MSSANNDFSFEDLLMEEAVKTTDNIDLVGQLGKVRKMEQDKVELPAATMDKETSRIKKEAASRDTKEESIDYFSSTAHQAHSLFCSRSSKTANTAKLTLLTCMARQLRRPMNIPAVISSWPAMKAFAAS